MTARWVASDRKDAEMDVWPNANTGGIAFSVSEGTDFTVMALDPEQMRSLVEWLNARLAD